MPIASAYRVFAIEVLQNTKVNKFIHSLDLILSPYIKVITFVLSTLTVRSRIIIQSVQRFFKLINTLRENDHIISMHQ